MTALTVKADVKPVELLLIEDNYGDVVLIREALRCAEIANNLTLASDGHEALCMLRRQEPHTAHPKPDLIFLDLNLPRVDGREVLRSIRADHELRSIPVVVLTGSNAAIERRGLQVDGYIVKPMTSEHIRMALTPLGAARHEASEHGASGDDPMGGPPDEEADPIAMLEQELADFTYAVSHDIAAPIRRMVEFSRLLLAELGEPVSERQQLCADHIRMAGETSQSMIEQLLTLSRVQHRPLERVHHDATHVMRVALLALDGPIQAAKADVSIEPLGQVFADSGLLETVFRNLLENAIRFGRTGVRPLIRVAAKHDETTWRIQICDNGCGVEPAYWEKAFEMFQRLNPDDALPGAGAGLTICRRIARRHGGEIRFIDRAQGACIELSLPRHDELHAAV